MRMIYEHYQTVVINSLLYQIKLSSIAGFEMLKIDAKDGP